MRWFVMVSLAVTVLLPKATWAQVTSAEHMFTFEKKCGVCHGTTSLVPAPPALRPIDRTGRAIVTTRKTLLNSLP